MIRASVFETVTRFFVCSFHSTLPLLLTMRLRSKETCDSALTSRVQNPESPSERRRRRRQRQRREISINNIHLYINVHTRIGAYRSNGLRVGRREGDVGRPERMGWSRFVAKSIEGWRARGHTGDKAGGKGAEA